MIFIFCASLCHDILCKKSQFFSYVHLQPIQYLINFLSKTNKGKQWFLFFVHHCVMIFFACVPAINDSIFGTLFRSCIFMSGRCIDINIAQMSSTGWCVCIHVLINNITHSLCARVCTWGGFWLLYQENPGRMWGVTAIIFWHRRLCSHQKNSLKPAV